MHTVEIAGKPIAIINSPKGHAAIHAPLLRARGARRRAGRRPGGRRPDLLGGRRSGGLRRALVGGRRSREVPVHSPRVPRGHPRILQVPDRGGQRSRHRRRLRAGRQLRHHAGVGDRVLFGAGGSCRTTFERCAHHRATRAVEGNALVLHREQDRAKTRACRGNN
jgi:hypothetical protein